MKNIRLLFIVGICAFFILTVFITFMILYTQSKSSKYEVNGVKIIFEPDLFPRLFLSDSIPTFLFPIEDPIEEIDRILRKNIPFYSLFYPANIKIIPLPKEEIDRSLKTINSAIKKYPPASIRTNLKRIYVADTLLLSDSVSGGTYSGDRIFLMNKGISGGYPDIFIERVFHAEFSSILLRNYKKNFNEIEWKKINPEGFQYTENGAEAIRSGRDLIQFDYSLIKIGFLNEYSTTNIENEFNSFAGYMFTNNMTFWEIVDSNEKLRKKIDMVVGFYHKLDPLFTEGYFRNIEKHSSPQ
ncbi:MAG: hypothetical protein HY427_00505 [Candidatus Levybacteria bacterium]|nr:hypothetical protein [Candidatus Levybacteria bacterium]